MNLSPEELRREIDAVLAEIDQVEAEVMDLFAEIGGPDVASRIGAYKVERELQTPFTGLRPPSSSRPATR
jgi:hypothetical protein